MLVFIASLVTALAPPSAGFTCGAGTLPDEATLTCVVDPAILGQARTAREEPVSFKLNVRVGFLHRDIIDSASQGVRSEALVDAGRCWIVLCV